MQHARNIPHPTAVEGHVHNLPLHFGQPPGIGIVPNKRAPARARLLTAIPHFAVAGRALLHHCLTVTMPTPHRFFCHRPSSVTAPDLLARALLR
jgi:hypothetical protein